LEDLQESFVRHATRTLARAYFNMDDFAAYEAISHTVRDRLIDSWNKTQQHHTKEKIKRVYYLSLEFLMGRSLDNAILNLGIKGNVKEALRQLGFELERVVEEERDAALGNGGLGRLAACFMDSLATMNYAAWGYGIRYTYGIFEQKIIDGYQTEFPDYWLTFDNPWEVPRLDVVYEVRFYGQVVELSTGIDGVKRYSWIEGETVEAVAYDVPIPGFNTKNTINIRLWSSKPKRIFDLASFNEGNYQASVEEQQLAEHITSVLYPNDKTFAGKELRLKQQYFFVCATLKDIIRRFKKNGRPWSEFPDFVAIQLNDTHPSLGIPELMRLLVDIEKLQWDSAWAITTSVYSFTNHTVLPEAMEKWSVELLEKLLPRYPTRCFFPFILYSFIHRHMQIIFDINLYFLQGVEAKFPNDFDRLRRMSIIEETSFKQVRMAHLAIVGSHTVNGVAALHSELLKKTIFRDFVDFYGVQKFTNMTNGITPRRWLYQANPSLSELITLKLGTSGWLNNLPTLKLLRSFADDPEFQQEWMAIKHANKVRLADYVRSVSRVSIDPETLFDVQVKRFHEYKRQLMNILAIIYRYLTLKQLTNDERQTCMPRTFIFAGKAAPGYFVAKMIIKLINMVAHTVNKDPDTQKYLKVVFIPDYNVSNAEIIIPASDISQHISTAGTEASGTSNMKFALNGGLIIGTLDGANIEIRDDIGHDNMFIFGALADDVPRIRDCQKYQKFKLDPQLEMVINALKANKFGQYSIIAAAIETITQGGDFYLISHDFKYCKRTQLP
jgi:glycogen phosphorylase